MIDALFYCESPNFSMITQEEDDASRDLLVFPDSVRAVYSGWSEVVMREASRFPEKQVVPGYWMDILVFGNGSDTIQMLRTLIRVRREIGQMPNLVRGRVDERSRGEFVTSLPRSKHRERGFVLDALNPADIVPNYCYLDERDLL